MKSPPTLNISYGGYSLKQHNTVEYLGCYLDSNLNGESMARRVLKKINTKLNFLWRQSNYLNYSSKRLLCNALIQPLIPIKLCIYVYYSVFYSHLFIVSCSGLTQSNAILTVLANKKNAPLEFFLFSISMTIAIVYFLNLTRWFPLHTFSTSWKHQKTLRFSDVFRELRKGELGTNGLNC